VLVDRLAIARSRKLEATPYAGPEAPHICPYSAIRPRTARAGGSTGSGAAWRADFQSRQPPQPGATLSIAQDPATCPPSLNPALTRYRLEPVEYPFVTGG